MRSSSLTLVDIASNSDLRRGDNCNNDLLLFYECYQNWFKEAYLSLMIQIKYVETSIYKDMIMKYADDR